MTDRTFLIIFSKERVFIKEKDVKSEMEERTEEKNVIKMY
jgi:hypothetical protein